MSQIKPWQIGLFVVAGLAALFGLWNIFFAGSKVPFANKRYLIDMASGSLYVADISGTRAITVPAKHPETGNRTLIPLTKTEDGRGWYVSERYRPVAEDLKLPLPDVIQAGTWTVTADLGSAKKL